MTSQISDARSKGLNDLDKLLRGKEVWSIVE